MMYYQPNTVMVPYLSFTVHYIDENMPEDHTGENIAGALSDTLMPIN